MKTRHKLTAIYLLSSLFSLTGMAQGTAFSYQGRLSNGGGVANGVYDLQFGLYDAASAGTQQGLLLTNSAVAVSNGLFTVTLDFGNQFPGGSRWLELGVRTNGSGAFTTLAPRQALTPVPYAIYAASAGSAATAGTAASATSAATATTANNFSGSLVGNVTGTQGATVVATVGGQTAANVAAGASVANAATSANTAGTLVKRDGTGGFLAGTITAASFSGNGNGLTNLSALALPTNVAFLNTNQMFSGSNNFSGIVIATNANNVLSGTLTGNVTGNATTATTATSFSGLLAGDMTGTQGATVVSVVGGQTAANVAAGASAANAATSANTAGTLVKRDGTGGFLAGTITAASFSGNGFGLTNLNALALSTNVALLNSNQVFISSNIFSGVVIATNVNNAFKGTLTGNAATATTANNFSGSLLGDVTGTQGATVVGAVGGQTAANVAGGASAANAATSANTAGTLVKRDGAGGFLAGAITAASVTGNGSGLTNLNATQLTSGTLADARLSANVALLNGTQSFTGSNNFAGALVATNGNSRFAGNGGGLTNLNTTNLIGTIPAASLTGTLPVASLPAAVVTNGASGVSITGTFAGNGSGVTNLNLAVNSGGAIQPLGGFAVASSPGVGGNPQSVVSADVNGDGEPDLISANSGDGTLTVLTNNGSGAFVSASTPGVGSSPKSVIAADVNGDGKPDLITANSGGNTLTVLTNDGSGAFVLAYSPLVGSKPYSVAAADVNGDGKLDLISANYGIGTGNTLTVLTNNGSGFGFNATYTVGSGAISVAAADVNGDGKTDLISANFNSGTFSVLTNNGSGGFVLASSPSAGLKPYFVLATDINGDGKVDLISPNNFANTLTVLTNNGSGGFVLASSPGVGGGPVSIAVADVNGDGKPDLISANANDNALSVLVNVGGGNFTLSSSPGVGASPSSVVAADVNGDGRADLISANSFDNSLSVLLNASIFNGTFFGIGTGLTSLNAAALTGIVPSAQIGGTYFNDVNFSSSGNSFTGDGTGLTSLNAGQLTFGTVDDARLSANVALRSGGNTFSGNQVVSGTLRIGSGTVFTNVQDGIFTAGTNTTGVKVVTNSFPVAFSTVPTVMATTLSQSGTDLPDVYSLTVRRVTTTNFVVNIFRVDTNGAAWSQSLRVSYHAWQ